MESNAIMRSELAVGVFSDQLYANSLIRRVGRAFELGWRYYLWDLPRFFAQRWRVGLMPFDVQAAVNPALEFINRREQTVRAPDGFQDALEQLQLAGVQLTLPPSRVVALLNCWETTLAAEGDLIECGCYRGATALLVALVSKLHGKRQKILMFDTFDGSPRGSKYDSLRQAREYLLPRDYPTTLWQLAVSLGVDDQLEIHPGCFTDTFPRLANRDLRFSFAHIDANLYQSTWEACNFVIPRVAPGGVVVFDDYHGPCDLGARLAIDRYFANSKIRPARLSGTSAYLRL
jgi:O-methyltransferase